MPTYSVTVPAYSVTYAPGGVTYSGNSFVYHTDGIQSFDPDPYELRVENGAFVIGRLNKSGAEMSIVSDAEVKKAIEEHDELLDVEVDK